MVARTKRSSRLRRMDSRGSKTSCIIWGLTPKKMSPALRAISSLALDGCAIIKMEKSPDEEEFNMYQTIGFIGTGNMGSAVARAAAKSGLAERP